jgi:hypothetical protein
MAAFWAVFTFGGSGSTVTAHGSSDLKKKNSNIMLAAVLEYGPFPVKCVFYFFAL